MGSYSVTDLEELEGEGPGGGVRKVRRALGASAFGFNYFTLPPYGSMSDGRGRHAAFRLRVNQEEVYFVVSGSGRLRVDGEEVELRPGRFVRVSPAATRQPVAGDDGLEFLTIGAPLDRLYEPPAWG